MGRIEHDIGADVAAAGALGGGSPGQTAVLAASPRWILDARDVIADGRELHARMNEDEREEFEELAEDLEDAIAYQEEVAAAAVLTDLESLMRRVHGPASQHNRHPQARTA